MVIHVFEGQKTIQWELRGEACLLSLVIHSWASPANQALIGTSTRQQVFVSKALTFQNLTLFSLFKQKVESSSNVNSLWYSLQALLAKIKSRTWTKGPQTLWTLLSMRLNVMTVASRHHASRCRLTVNSCSKVIQLIEPRALARGTIVKHVSEYNV